MSQKYYIVDYGKDMVSIAEVVMDSLKSNDHKTVVYLTDLPEYLMVQEVNELQYLIHKNGIVSN